MTRDPVDVAASPAPVTPVDEKGPGKEADASSREEHAGHEEGLVLAYQRESSLLLRNILVALGLGWLLAAGAGLLLLVGLGTLVLMAQALAAVALGAVVWGSIGAWVHATLELRARVEEQELREALVGTPEAGRPWMVFAAAVLLTGLMVRQVVVAYRYRHLDHAAIRAQTQRVREALDAASGRRSR